MRTSSDDTMTAAFKLDAVSKIYGRREIKKVPKILRSGETVDCIAQGRYEGPVGIPSLSVSRLCTEKAPSQTLSMPLPRRASSDRSARGRSVLA